PKRLDKILAETRAIGYGTRDPAFGGGAYGSPPVDDGLAAISIPLPDRTRGHRSGHILWIKNAFTIQEFAARHLADLRAAAAEIVDSLRDSTRTGKRR